MSHLFGHDQPLTGQGDGQSPSFVTLFDPRVRMISALVFAVLVVAIDQILFGLCAFLLAFCAMLFANLPWRLTLKRMAAMDGFIIVMLFMLPFTTPGTPVFTFLGAEASKEGFEHAIMIGIRANAIILMMLSLFSAMTPVTMGHTLFRLKCPATLVQLLMFTVRYVSVLHDEYQRLRVAMRLRGFKARNCFHTYRSLGYLFGMLLVRSFERAERVLEAMKCRGFTGQFPIIDQLQYKARDWGFLTVFLFITTSLLVLDRTYVIAY